MQGQQFIQYISRFPQKAIIKALGNRNPMATNLIGMVNKGDVKGLEQFARNLAKEKGQDVDKMFEEARSFFGE